MGDTKDIEIGAGRYRLSKMTALVAGRVHNWLVAGGAKLAQKIDEDTREKAEAALVADDRPPEERAEGYIAMVWMAMSAEFSEELLERIQIHCLKTCAQYPPDAGEDAPPVPVMAADGRWAVRSIDAPDAAELVVEALKFNISPFFTARASSSAQAARAARP